MKKSILILIILFSSSICSFGQTNLRLYNLTSCDMNFKLYIVSSTCTNISSVNYPMKSGDIINVFAGVNNEFVSATISSDPAGCFSYNLDTDGFINGCTTCSGILSAPSIITVPALFCGCYNNTMIFKWDACNAIPEIRVQ